MAGEEADLEWIVLDACKTLRYKHGKVYGNWQPAFRGLHYILGFHSTCMDRSWRGHIFGKYLTRGNRIKTAWVKATKSTERWWKWGAYLLAEGPGTNTYNDHLPGHGYVSPDPYPVYIENLRYDKWRCT